MATITNISHVGISIVTSRIGLFSCCYQHCRLAAWLVPGTLSANVEIETTCHLLRCP